VFRLLKNLAPVLGLVPITLMSIGLGVIGILNVLNAERYSLEDVWRESRKLEVLLWILRLRRFCSATELYRVELGFSGM